MNSGFLIFNSLDQYAFENLRDNLIDQLPLSQHACQFVINLYASVHKNRIVYK